VKSLSKKKKKGLKTQTPHYAYPGTQDPTLTSAPLMRRLRAALICIAASSAQLASPFGDAPPAATGGFGQKEGQEIRLQERPKDKLKGYLTRLRNSRAAMAKVGLPVPPVAVNAARMPISMFTLYATGHYPKYLNLTLESMRWNPSVTFNIVNIIDSPSEANELLAAGAVVPNVKVLVLTLRQFIKRVKERLKIHPDIPDTKHLILKAHDYKPAFGGLWADIIAEQKAAYWGWHDLDEILGNFEAFTPLFRQHDVIGACDGRSCGPFMLFKHSAKEQFATIYTHAPQYLTKLAARKHDMLDEEGCCGGQPDDHSHASWMIAHGECRDGHDQYVPSAPLLTCCVLRDDCCVLRDDCCVMRDDCCVMLATYYVLIAACCLL
jgi:hypothetical protein